MKKLFSIFAATLFAASVSATTFTYSTSVASQTKDGITVTLSKAKGQAEPAAAENYNTKAKEIRLYASNTITISGTNISEVKITCAKQGNKDYADLTANTGTLKSGGASTAATDKKVDTWTGNTNELVLTLGKGQRILYQIVVNGAEGEGGGSGEGEGQTGDVAIKVVGGYVDPMYFEGDGTVELALWDYTTWTEPDASGYVYPEGDGTWVTLTIAPKSIEDVSGTYKVDDESLDPEFSGIEIVKGKDTTKVDLTAGSVTVKLIKYTKDEENGDVANLEIKANLTGSDKKVYTINATVDCDVYEVEDWDDWGDDDDDDDEQAVENIEVEKNDGRIIMHEGKLYIIREGKVYSVTGAQVR